MIKIGREGEYNAKMSPVYRQSKAGQSKLKNLNEGVLQTGIYRNFYMSQLHQP